MSDTTSIVVAEKPITPDADLPVELRADAYRLNLAWRRAKLYASSLLIPDHLRNKPADVQVAMELAELMGEPTLMVLQAIVMVSGRAGWRTDYLISRSNRVAGWKRRIWWETEGAGDTLSVTARAVRSDGIEVSETVSYAMAVADGWTKNPKYKSMPERMLKYRAATALIRLHCPEAMYGLPADVDIDVPVIEAVTVAPTGRSALGLRPAPALPDHGEPEDIADDPTPAERAAIVAREMGDATTPPETI